jgi:CHAD domain-containing protein/CYTH domain-containing protein
MVEGGGQMRSLTPLLSLLVDEGARRLALARLEEATAARSRMGSSDPEALHDYRVALRRLRSCLRSYRRTLRSTLSRKSLRRLRRLAHGTNRSRDLEVHLAWLSEQRDRAGEAERPGVGWLHEQLTAAQREAVKAMRDLDERIFPKLHDRLVAELTEFRTTIRLDGSLRPRSMAAATGSLVREASERLRDRLPKIHGYSSETAIHRARIAAKHLRYLCEPFASAVAHAEEIVDRLKQFQNGFGDVHDAHVFLTELRGMLLKADDASSSSANFLPGIETLMVVLEARGRQAFEEVSRDWLHDAAEPFFQQVEAVARAISELAIQDREVERKFLLTGLPPLEGAEGPVEIEQGYLPGERLVERVRRIQSDEGVELARAVKEGSGLTRLEIEEPVTPAVFEQLWPLTEGRRLRKRRYRIADGDLTWEIDQFLDRDLILAEVELPGEPADVSLPDWLRPHVDREVTEDSAYSNFHLASASNGESAVPGTGGPQ